MQRNYESVKESRYFSKRGTRTIEGSTVISEQPTLTEEQNNYMFAIKGKNGWYKTEYKGDHIEWCMAHEVDNIKWYKYYLEAEESLNGTDDKAVSVLEVMKEALALKDVTIRQLRDDNERMRERIERAEPAHSLDSLHGIKPEHAYERQDHP